MWWQWDVCCGLSQLFFQQNGVFTLDNMPVSPKATYTPIPSCSLINYATHWDDERWVWFVYHYNELLIFCCLFSKLTAELRVRLSWSRNTPNWKGVAPVIWSCNKTCKHILSVLQNALTWTKQQNYIVQANSCVIHHDGNGSDIGHANGWPCWSGSKEKR